MKESASFRSKLREKLGYFVLRGHVDATRGRLLKLLTIVLALNGRCAGSHVSIRT
jgi:hypothetical protein